MKEKPIRERRKLKRRSLSYYMLVLDANKQQTIGHLVDITAEGFMMDSQYNLPINKEYRLRFDTTSDVADKTFIEMTACAKWSAVDTIETNLYDIGFEITSISPQDAEIIKRIIKKYGVRDSFSYNFQNL